jgi:hypothetical protein
MPGFGFANGALTCPACGTTIDDQAWFQWGFCRDRAQRPEAQYVVGDQIRWHACADGRVLPWTYFFRDGQEQGGNHGVREEPHVIVRNWANTHHSEPCPVCRTPLDGSAVEIRDNAIVRAWLLRPGELPVAGEVLRIRPDGTMETLSEHDHRMDIVYDC